MLLACWSSNGKDDSWPSPIAKGNLLRRNRCPNLIGQHHGHDPGIGLSDRGASNARDRDTLSRGRWASGNGMLARVTAGSRCFLLDLVTCRWCWMGSWIGKEFVKTVREARGRLIAATVGCCWNGCGQKESCCDNFWAIVVETMEKLET